ncbi:hypothetical protein O181_061871 [Austropuccinia psidii MF-1]|uniref:Uncharacterized protein n=1 Tax=Austropuccinia psidii MF-1 TaxID=1389203 RepID=A0A9Q3ENP0_9BASI|nr:hypothetical protein [Austropuccinia psidii MF-1]
MLHQPLQGKTCPHIFFGQKSHQKSKDLGRLDARLSFPPHVRNVYGNLDQLEKREFSLVTVMTLPITSLDAKTKISSQAGMEYPLKTFFLHSQAIIVLIMSSMTVGTTSM